MSLSTDRAWRKWGRLDPYFGVVTLPEFKRDRISAHREAFFETGRLDVHNVIERIKHLYRDVPMTRALDFGSGVGRLVLPLSKHYGHVVGIDISEAMIAEARANCTDAGVDNVEFALSDDRLSALTGSFDLVHSYIVLQHIPNDRGLALSDRMLERLNPGGVAVLHYSLQRTLSPLKAMAYAVKHSVPLGRIIMNILQFRRPGTPTMQMNNYRLADIVATYEKNGMTEIIVIPDWQGSVFSARVYGRKKH